jgi:outer membrane lipoprotein-sorting protein
MRGKKSLFLAVPAGVGICLAMISLAGIAADAKTSTPALSASQIVEKHIAARGGLQAWRALQSISLSGKMDAGSGSNDRSRALAAQTGGGGAAAAMAKAAMANKKEGTAADAAKQVQLPFVLEMKRPGKSRVEIEFQGKTAVQVYDGTKGWKLRPFLNRNEVEPFTADEAKSEAVRPGYVDGPLVDYAAKGTKVALERVEPVEGHDAYKLKLTMKTGAVQHIWIDAHSFLDVKVEGTQRRMDGRMRDVWVYQRDFRSVQGLMVPFLLETTVDGYPNTHQMAIEKVTLNPKLDDALFNKPGGA